MSFINWGHESPEQKAIRKRFEEEEAIFEQRAAAVSAAAAAAAGSSKLGISVPAYCGGEKIVLDYVAIDFDLLTSKKFKFTDSELDNYDNLQEDLDTQFRADRNAYQKQQNEIRFFQEVGRVSSIPPEPPLPTPTIYHKGLTMDSPFTRRLPVTEYPEWTELKGDPESSASQKMPNVEYINYLEEVELILDLPSSGSPGDAVWCIEDLTFYAWDQEAGEFSAEFYDLWLEPIRQAQNGTRDTAAKSKYALILASRPFMAAAKYLLDYKLKNKF
jgi:hypothetical protein